MTKKASTQKKESKHTKASLLKQLTETNGIGQKLAGEILKFCGGKNLDRVVAHPEEASKAVRGLSRSLAIEVRNNVILSKVRLTSSDNFEKLIRQRIKAEEIFEKYRGDLLNRPGVTGAHIGLRRLPSGTPREEKEYCIRIHVAEKYVEDDPMMLKPFPKDIDGVRINVLERSYQRATGDRLVNPLKGGAPILLKGKNQQRYGTLGGLVKVNGIRHFITNNHVVGDGGGVVIQPPSGNSSGLQLEIGTVGVGLSLRDTQIDVALIKPKAGRSKRAEIEGLPDGSTFHASQLTSQNVADRTSAFKIGAATGFNPIRAGQVKSINTTIQFGVNDLMTGQIAVENESEQIIDGGDSGALLLIENSSHTYFVVGLVHSKSTDGRAIIATHFRSIMDKFNVTTLDN